MKVFFLLLGQMLCVQAYASEDRALFWQLTSGNATVYLFGSIHYADSSFYPLRDEVEQAFQVSDQLVVELDITRVDSDLMRSGVTSYGAGESVRDHISSEVYGHLVRYLADMGVSPARVVKQRPGMLVLTLAGLQAVALGLDPQQGIDLHFIRKAKGQKDIIELETAKQQLEIFLNIDNAELLLKETLQSMDGADVFMAEMVNHWKQGDEEALLDMIFDDTVEKYPGFASIFDQLFYQRNHKMTQTITELIQKGGRYFVVVGAAHLLGEEGIVELLKGKGFEVGRR